jgi:pimeloyl-ACP methyl ester carboxylesterase
MPGVIGMVAFGSSAQSWHECLLGSSRRHAELTGFSGRGLERRMSHLEELQRLVYLEGKTPKEALELRPELERVAMGWADGDRVFGRTARFFQQLQAIDLREAWRRTTVPVLALHAEHDWLCTRQDAAQIIALVNAGERSPNRVVELPEVDHHMRKCATLAESLEPGTGRFAESVLEQTLDWLQMCVGSHASGNTQP